MSYATVDTGVRGWTARIAERTADDLDTLTAYRALAASAAALYDASLQADTPREALELTQRATRHFPYSPELLDYAITLSLHHGDFGVAKGLIEHAERLGLDELVQRQRAWLSDAVDQWNAWAGSPDLMRAFVSEHGPDALGLRAREAWFVLNAQQQVPAASPSREDAPPHRAAPSRRPRTIWAAGLAGLAGGSLLALAFTLPRTDASIEEPPAQASLVTASSPQEAPQTSSAERAAAALLAQDDARALQEADSDTTAVGRVLRETTWARLSSATDEGWKRRDFALVASALNSASSRADAPAEALYRLAVSAHESGDPSTAFPAAARYLETENASARSDRTAQAASIAAASAPTPQEALRYAQIIREAYSGTIYDNSTIQSIIDHGR